MSVAVDFNDNIGTCGDRCAISCKHGSANPEILLIPKYFHSRVPAVLAHEISGAVRAAIINHEDTPDSGPDAIQNFDNVGFDSK
ncbi:MAG: hypothetical protein NTAFB09_22780 [Nitrosospira sp.]